MKINEVGAIRALVQSSFFDFVREFWNVIIEEEPVFNWHVEFLCSELQAMAERVFKREERPYDVLCNIPPGSTKSTICSQMFPAWVWTRMPSAQFICVSYAYAIAQKDSLKTRDIVQSDLYQKCFPEITLREDANTKGLFVNTKKGFRLAVGVGGAITGMHGHFLLVDDPLNPEQAYSEAELRMVNRWMRTTLPSRRIPKNVAPIILIQQRLHQMDPSGEMLERYQGNKLRHLCLPGELTKDVSPPELASRYVNGLLDPVRLSQSVLAEMAKELGPYGYAGQILQTPIPPEGGMFDVSKFNRMVEAPPLVRIVRSWDKACLVAGTQINTHRGCVPIEAVRVGDRVMTRKGYQSVKQAWLTKYTDELVSVVFSNGSVVTGTSDHLVFCPSQQCWIPLKDLDNTCICLYDPKTGKSESSKEKSMFELGGGNPVPAAVISTGISAPCIATSGLVFMEAYPRAIIYTTKTKMGVITKWKIWNCGPSPRIINTIAMGGNFEKLCGIGIERMVKSCKEQHKKLFAGGSLTFVVCAVNPFLPVVSKPVIASGFVVEETIGSKFQSVPVYDLSIEAEPEFFANGILVHNSTEGAGKFTVGLKLGLDKQGRPWIVDIKRGQWGSTRREANIRETAETDGIGVEILLEIEGGSGGKESGESSVRNLSGFRVTTFHPTGDKETRAYPASTQVGAGNIFILDRHWTQAFLDELQIFPFGKYSDQVDAFSGAFNLIARKKIKVGGMW